MMDEQSKQYDCFFIPQGYKFCIIQSEDINLLRQKQTILIFQSDEITIGQIIARLRRQERLPQKFTGDKVLGLELGGEGILLDTFSLFQLKHKLYNHSLTNLNFVLRLVDPKEYKYECFSHIDFQKHRFYKQIHAKENQIELCIQFPQFNGVYYHNFSASARLCDQIKKFLQKSESEWKKDLSNKTYTVTCKKCDKQIKQLQAEVYKHFLTHFTMQIRFQCLADIQESGEYPNIIIKRSVLQKDMLWKVNYKDARNKKVKSILEGCDSLNKYMNYGLNICNTLLRPSENISKVHSEICLANKYVEAYLVQQSQIFYSIYPKFEGKTFNLEQVISLFEDNKKRKQKESLLRIIYERRDSRISEIANKTLKKSSFIDPILGYTSELFYSQLNAYLRDTAFGWENQQEYKSIFYRISFALIESLFNLPNYSGTVYRGVKFRDEITKVGQIICFKSFSSTSQMKSKAEQFGKATQYKLQILTGKQISNYSYFKNQAEILLLPFTYFEVLEVSENQYGEKLIHLQEIPVPRRQSQSILLWVDDNPQEGSRIYQALFNKNPKITTELIQLLSNEHLDLWMSKFSYALASSRKVSLITDMKRGDKLNAGIETIRKVRQYIPDVNIFVYVYNTESTAELMRKEGVGNWDKVKIGNKRAQVIEFINEKVFSLQEINFDSCKII